MQQHRRLPVDANAAKTRKWPTRPSDRYVKTAPAGSRRSRRRSSRRWRRVELLDRRADTNRGELQTVPGGEQEDANKQRPGGGRIARRGGGAPIASVCHVPRRRGRNANARSREWRPGDLRHTGRSAESCCLPALTRFTGACCTGPDRHTPERALRFSRYPSPPDPALAGPSALPSGRPGGLPERPNGHAWKAWSASLRGFKSHTSAGHDTPGPTGSGVRRFGLQCQRPGH